MIKQFDCCFRPPRYMGDGFVIAQSNYVDVYYYMDEPGLVPMEPEVLHMARSGETYIQVNIHNSKYSIRVL